MSSMKKYRLPMAALSALALTMTACSSNGDDTASDNDATSVEATEESAGSDEVEETEEAEAGTVTVESWRGPVEVPSPPQRPAVTDNRAVRILEDWGVDIVAAPLDVFPRDIGYQDEESVANLGNHREPDFEAIVAADPDVVLNGYRYASHFETIEELLPNATMVDISMDIVENDVESEFRKQLDLLGALFDHREEADQLYEDFEQAKDRANDAYDPSQTVMGLLTSGGDISYAAPVTGRSVGPLFSLVDMTPALEQEGDDNTHGDDISVEAIAQANPDWIIVLDRDAAVLLPDDEQYTTAEELIKNSEALKNVTAVKEDQIIYLPNHFYQTEDVMAYTEVLEAMADAFGK